METQGFSRACCYKLIRNIHCPQTWDIVQQHRVRGLLTFINVEGVDCMLASVSICVWACGPESFQSFIPRPWGGIAFKWIPLYSYSSSLFFIRGLRKLSGFKERAACIRCALIQKSPSFAQTRAGNLLLPHDSVRFWSKLLLFNYKILLDAFWLFCVSFS